MKQRPLPPDMQGVLFALADLIEQAEEPESFYPFAKIMTAARLPDRARVRRACRALKRRGLTEYSSALWRLDGDGPAGAGYTITQAGIERALWERARLAKLHAKILGTDDAAP